MSASTGGFRLGALIVGVFALLVVVTGSAVAYLGYERSRSMLLDEALDTANRTGKVAAMRVSESIKPLRSGVRLLMLNPDVRGKDRESWLKILPYMTVALRNTPTARAFYFASKSGGLFYVRRPLPQIDGTPPEGSAYMALSIERIAGQARGRRQYYDEELNLLAELDDPHLEGLDARDRLWFKRSMENAGLVRTRAYPFYTSAEVGHTVSMATEDRQIVVAADFRHQLLDSLLIDQRLTPSTRLVLVDRNGVLLASDQIEDFNHTAAELPFVRDMRASVLGHLEDAPEGRVKLVEFGGSKWYVRRQLLESEDGDVLYLGMAVPQDELLADAYRIRRSILVGTLMIMLLTIPLGIWLSTLLTAPLVRLTARAKRLQNLDFEPEPLPATSHIREFLQLGNALELSRNAIQRLGEILEPLTTETDMPRLLASLLQATLGAVPARGGVLYTRAHPEDSLLAAAGCWGRTPIELPDDTPSFAVEQVLIHGRSRYNAVDDEACTRLGIPATATFSIPLITRQKHGVGVLQLFVDKQPTGNEQLFMEALSRFVALALETRGLLERQKALFDSFIQLIASAIDAKSPYTGGHCSRVPELARLLAEATCAEQNGPYAGFQMGEADWEALHIATWLHDCGKITTPEYVVDKATKLETLYDRIHEVRMRFEVLKRDAEIIYLNACLTDKTVEPTAREVRDQLLASLDEEFAFIARCNTEFIDETALQRLRQIAERTWLRTLDDRLGTAGEERVRQDAQPVTSLPVLEKLLSDRPEQRIGRSAEDRYAVDNPWGFRLPIPELLYDRGELKNLSIRRGTLTEEERFKINEHVIQSIKMLSALPFPPELAQVPEIAGGHHERIDGQGYPRRLAGDQLSPQARMVAIADVFEALTARDRPYKPYKTLAQTLCIMRSMCEEGHLDAQLFRIFVSSEACLLYARQYLSPEQLDTEDLAGFIPGGLQ